MNKILHTHEDIVATLIRCCCNSSAVVQLHSSSADSDAVLLVLRCTVLCSEMKLPFAVNILNGYFMFYRICICFRIGFEFIFNVLFFSFLPFLIV